MSLTCTGAVNVRCGILLFEGKKESYHRHVMLGKQGKSPEHPKIQLIFAIVFTSRLLQ